MAQDTIGIAPAAVSPVVAPILIQTVVNRDAAGNAIETQAVVRVDELGRNTSPSSEGTQQEILRVLYHISDSLAMLSGNLPLTPKGP